MPNRPVRTISSYLSDIIGLMTNPPGSTAGGSCGFDAAACRINLHPGFPGRGRPVLRRDINTSPEAIGSKRLGIVQKCKE